MYVSTHICILYAYTYTPEIKKKEGTEQNVVCNWMQLFTIARSIIGFIAFMNYDISTYLI